MNLESCADKRVFGAKGTTCNGSAEHVLVLWLLYRGYFEEKHFQMHYMYTIEFMWFSDLF